MLFAQLTDIHVGFEPFNPEEMNKLRLDRVIDVLAAMSPRPQFLLATGDITESGAVEHYQIVRNSLDRLPFPVFCCPGNHDKRAALREVFPELPAPNGFIQYGFDAGGLRIVVIDTSDETRHGGVYCATRAAWLEAELSAHNKPVVIAMHHPPAPSGIPWITAHEYEGWVKRLRDVLSEHSGRIVGVLAGHYHRPMTASWARMAVFVCPSSAPRVDLDMRPLEPAPIPDGRAMIVDEPPSFGIHQWNGETLVSHAVSVGDFPVLARINEKTGPMIGRLIAERAPGASL